MAITAPASSRQQVLPGVDGYSAARCGAGAMWRSKVQAHLVKSVQTRVLVRAVKAEDRDLDIERFASCGHHHVIST